MTAVQATASRPAWPGVTAYAVFGGADFGAGFWDLAAGSADTRARAPGAHRRRHRPGLGGEPHLAHLRPGHPVDRLPARLRRDHDDPVRAALPRGRSGWSCGARPSRSDRSRRVAGRRAAGAVFAISSVMTPFLLGAVAGAIARAASRRGRRRRGDPWTSWLNPTSVLLGVMAVVGLRLPRSGLPRGRRAATSDGAGRLLPAPGDRRGRGRRRPGRGRDPGAGVDAPDLADELTGAAGRSSWLADARDRGPGPAWRRGARHPGLAVGAVVAIIAGWGVAQYPYILPPR